MPRHFQLVDVFNEGPFSGNPLGVVFSAEDLSTDAMQRIARWLNLSETVFLMAPSHQDADYRARIFTPDRELPFAGHPTLGSCHAWLSAGGQPKVPREVIQECGVGLVRIRQHDRFNAFEAPPLIRSGSVDEELVIEIAGFLGIDRGLILDCQWTDNGPGWVTVLLGSAQQVLDLKPAKSLHRRIELGVVGLYPAASATAYEVRAFIADQYGSIVEDPVTGSLNASAAQWLIRSGRVTAPYVASQGTCLGRSGRVHITVDDNDQVWVGGNAATMFSGTGNF